jgi:6-phosphogluconolactonase (cycloisomerase 2 family)
MKSHRLTRSFGVGALVLGTGFLATNSFAGATSAKDQAPSRQALFVETDQGPNNSVISYTRGTDGTISYVATYPTGGAGAAAAGSAADPLASQSGLALVDNGRELIATNPGSNSVSVFAVDGPYLSLIQQVPSGGQFPDSIASRGNLVAVINAGNSGSLSEYRLVGNHLQALNNETRSLGLTNSNPPDFHHGVGQVGYSPNGKFLVITTKLSSNAYDVFTVAADGTLSASAAVTTADNALPFAFAFDANGNLAGAEASNSSVSTYSFNANGSLTLIGSVSDGQAALCWITAAQGHFFGSNAGSGNVSSFGELADGTPTLLNATAATAQPGTIDSAASPDGQFLYLEAGGSGALDVYAVSASGALSPIETLWNLPTPYEGIAVS